jgi:hypothetical protein
MHEKYLSEITTILLDSTHSEVKFAEDSALWDELLSNPKSIYYLTYYNNRNGIDRDETTYIDLKTNQPITAKDILSKIKDFATIPVTYLNEKNKKILKPKKKYSKKIKKS